MKYLELSHLIFFFIEILVSFNSGGSGDIDDDDDDEFLPVETSLLPVQWVVLR